MDTPLSWTHTRQTIIRPCCGSLIAMYSSSSLILYQMHWSLWTSRAHWSTHSVWSQPISRVSLASSLSLSLFWVIWNFWIKVPNYTSLVKAVLHNKFQLSTVDANAASIGMKQWDTQDADGKVLCLFSVQSPLDCELIRHDKRLELHGWSSDWLAM